MQRDLYVPVRLSQDEASRLSLMQELFNCTRSEAIRILLRGLNVDGIHGRGYAPARTDKLTPARTGETG